MRSAKRLREHQRSEVFSSSSAVRAPSWKPFSPDRSLSLDDLNQPASRLLHYFSAEDPTFVLGPILSPRVQAPNLSAASTHCFAGLSNSAGPRRLRKWRLSPALRPWHWLCLRPGTPPLCMPPRSPASSPSVSSNLPPSSIPHLSTSVSHSIYHS